MTILGLEPYLCLTSLWHNNYASKTLSFKGKVVMGGNHLNC